MAAAPAPSPGADSGGSAALVARRPIPWTRDADAVDLVFLGVVPAPQPRAHLEFMRRLARALTDAAAAAALRAAPDEPAVRAWLRDHLQMQ